MNTHAPTCQPHAVLDLRSCNWKVVKIERLPDLTHRPQPIHLRATTGCRCHNICIKAERATFEIERPDPLGRHALDITPDAFLKPLRWIIRTLIYRIEPLHS